MPSKNDSVSIVRTIVPVKDRRPNSIHFDEPSITVQSAKDECDINCIVARALSGADVSRVDERVALYGDFSNVPSYQAALDLVRRAEGMFMDMPAKVRERFANDPSRMVDFLQDPANRDEAVKLGLVKAPEEPAPPAPPVPPAPAPAAGA